MSNFTTGAKLNSIFLKIAAILVVTVGLVVGTIKLVESSYSFQLARHYVAEQALSNSDLVGTIISGAVKFGKGEQVEEVFKETASDSNNQLVGAIALSADETDLAIYGTSPEILTQLRALARNALKSGVQVSSDDGLSVAWPLRFGVNDTVIGAYASAWTPERVLDQTRIASQKAFYWAFSVFLVAVVLALLVCGQLIVKPLRKFRTAIQALGESKFDFEVPGLGRGDEIGDIGKSLSTLREQLEAVHAVQQEANFKGAAFMGSSAALMVVDRDRVIRYMNPRMIALFKEHRGLIGKSIPGFDPSHLIGSQLEAYIFGDANFGAILNGGNEESAKTVLRIGDIHLALAVSGVSDANGSPMGHVLEWADVTQDILIRATLEAIEANQVKADFSPSGALVSSNAAFSDCLSSSTRSLNGRNLADLVIAIPSSQSTPAEMLEDARNGKVFAGRMELAASNGNSVILDGSVTPIQDANGRTIQLLLLGNDVTDAEAKLDAARAAREDAERQQNQVVEALRVGLERLSKGDLTAAITSPFNGSYEQLRSDYNDALRTLADAMNGIARSAESIHNEARDISSTADGLSRRTESNSATLEETAAALDTLTTSVRAAAAGADQADTAVSAAKTNAENSGQVVLETVSAMDQIAESSERITSIIKVIDDIAFQTNLLALNAGVEAARAGDAGRGFAVVASEVRALAQRSSDAAREINDLIAKSATQVKTGVQLVGRTGQALQQIVESVSEISKLVSDIAGSSRQQSASLAEINNSVGQLDQSTQQNAARLEETTAASEGLRQNALSLVDAVSKFRLKEDSCEGRAVIRSRTRGTAVANANTMHIPPETKRLVAKASIAKPIIEKATAQWEDF